MRTHFLLVAGIITFCPLAILSLKEGECEVCVGVISKVYKKIPSDDLKSADAIQPHLMDFCRTAKTKENKFCYYIGGLEESATGMLPLVTKPMTYQMPALKICEKIVRQDPQVCELRYDKQIDLTKVDLKKLKVRDLKKILGDWDELCDGCLEKTDFIKRIEELKPLHLREEL